MAVRFKFKAHFSATELNKSGGKALDTALDGAVQITRREQRFVLIREEALAALIEEEREARPQTLEDLLQDYDAEKIKSLARGFMDHAPAGKERI
jgi:hypothetical protein